ncbi:MAG: hypothetical protein HY849_02835 [Nitrosomonadales bacterium]|nr:hypothetical protein [Nitrosomonadales bacterium]
MASLVLAALLIPLDKYQSGVEAELSSLFHEPVKIKRLKVLLWPVPHLGVEGLVIGEQAGIAVDLISARISLAALLRGQCVIPRVEIEGGRVAQSKVEAILSWITESHVSSPKLFCQIGELRFSDIALELPRIGVERASGSVVIDDGEVLKSVSVSIPGRHLFAELTPRADGALAIKADMPELLLPGKNPVRLERLQLNGVFRAPVLELQSLSLGVMGGGLKAKARVEWGGGLSLVGGWGFVGDRFAFMLPSIAGRLTADRLNVQGEFSAKGAEMKVLLGNLKLAADVEVAGGAIEWAHDPVKRLSVNEAKAHLGVERKICEMSGLHLKLYGGELDGSGRFGLADRQIQADAVVTGLELGEIVDVLTDSARLTGKLDGQGRLSISLADLAQFPHKGRLDAAFLMKDGVLGGGKLVRAVNTSVRQADKDELNFQEMSGALVVSNGAIQVANLKLAADLYDAEGEVRVSPERQLEGVLDADVKMTASLVSLPLYISGTLDAPVVRPAGSTVAGAALGTAILGPWIGTAIGIRVGGALDRVFRHKQELDEGVAPKAPAGKAAPKPATRKTPDTSPVVRPVK